MTKAHHMFRRWLADKNNCFKMNQQIPTVTCELGQLIGTVSKDMDGNPFYSFRGIPYARPPVGELRFKAPLPALPWQGIFEATKNGNCCYSKDLFTKEFVGSEDCLNLNVYTPTLSANDENLLPVMVWIHGGGFICGSNHSDVYGPEFLITSKVVVVAINYRIGLLGFLSMKDPSAKVPGNAGFKDMVMALKWIKHNIKSFRGDPNNVTIFGQSAGGAAVHLLMLSPMSKDLFHKAIAQSGCALNPWSRGRQCDEKFYEILGCGHKSDSDILKYLQNLSVELLLKFQGHIEYLVDPDKKRPYGLVIERKNNEQAEPAFICEEPIDIILSGNSMKLPFMIGYTKLEGLVVDTYRPSRTVNMMDDFTTNIPHFLGYKAQSQETKTIGQQIKKMYYGSEEPNQYNKDKFYEMVTDNLFLYGIYTTVLKHVQNSNSSIYFYRLSLETSLNFLQVLMKNKKKGVAHGDDVAYIFKNTFTPSLSTNSLEYASIKRIVKLWTNFAHFGNPTPEGNFPLTWKHVSEKQIGFLDIDKDLSFNNNFEHRSLYFWNKLYSQSPYGKKFAWD